MWQNKIDRITAEFCDKGRLQEYEEVLRQILTKIEDSGCRISTREDDYGSRHLFMPDDCLIQISFKRPFENPEDVLWTILHEFGHHLSGRTPKEDDADFTKVYLREELAWDYAREEVSNYPKLQEKIADFEEYRLHCLQGYLKLKNSP